MDEHLGGLALVGVEFSDGAFVQVKAKQSAEVAGTEPGLVFEEEGVEVEFVAGEDVRNQIVFVHQAVLGIK
jgi:hypothetical protein